MNLPRLLIVDDQYARDPTERSLFLRKVGLVEEGAGNAATSGERIIGQAVFCSGQHQVDDWIENDYQIVREAAAAGEWAMVLLDVRFDSGKLEKGRPLSRHPEDESFGETVRSQLAADYPNLPVVMLTSKGQEELEDRDTPYLSKRGLEPRALAKEMLRHACLTPEQTQELLELGQGEVARGQATVAAFQEAFVYAAEDVPVLILGESGVGKEVMARYIQRTSHRKSGPFITVNMAAIPNGLLESTLFGHERGAFTGATSQHIGYFEQAHGGTLFLDEIGDMPLEAQVKVLRAVDPNKDPKERVIMRVGGRQPIEVDIRLLCATSRNLPRMVLEGTFREDLYYRIGAAPITIPPLRERVEDIVPLTQTLLDKYMAKHVRAGITFSPEAKKRLEHYPFPGNVRELENVIQWIVIRTGSDRVISHDNVTEALEKANISHPRRWESKSTTEKALGLSNEEIHVATIPSSSATASPPPSVTLEELPPLLAAVRIDKDNPFLRGAMPRLDEAFSEFVKRLTGAAIERCRDPDSGKPNLQKTARLLTGNSTLKTSDPVRFFKKILGKQQDEKIKDEEIEQLAALWNKTNRPP